ncbi:hypothetical protein ACFL5Y_00625 [Candidatus Omnitrophota bacterium]
MLSKEDYRDYLNQIEKVEKDMRDAYSVCVAKAEDDGIRNMCIRLMEDETKHAHLVEDLEKLILEE